MKAPILIILLTCWCIIVNHKHNQSKTLWKGPFLYLNALMFLVFSNVAFFYLYPLYLQAIGSSAATIGWVMGLMPISTVASRPFMGKWVARRGEHRVIMTGLIIIFLSTLAYHGLQQVAWPMILVRIAHGIGLSAFVTAAVTAIARLIPPERRGQAYSYTGAMVLAAVALMPLAGEQLIRGFGYPALFNSAAAVAFLAGILTYMQLKGNRVQEVTGHGKHLFGPLLRRGSIWITLAAILLFVQGHATVLNFIALHANRLGLRSGSYFAAAASIAFILRITLGFLIDRYGKKFFMKGSYIVFGLGIILIPFISRSDIFYVSSLLYGIGLAFLFPSAIALAADQARGAEELPAVMSLATGVFDLGFISGTVLSGWVADYFSLDILFLSAGAMCFLGFVLMYFPVQESGASVRQAQ